MCQQNKGDFSPGVAYTVRKNNRKEVSVLAENRDDETLDLDDWIFSGEEYSPSER